MSETTYRRARAKSAHARLLSSPSDNVVDYTKSRRVQSARMLKRQHESSEYVLPRPASRASLQQTVYSTQFCKKDTPPAPLRPTSPTRRNNPHPSSRFMTWRMPTKTLEHRKAVRVSEETLADVNRKFYDDYVGLGNDSRNELTHIYQASFREMDENPDRDLSGITGKQMELGIRKSSKNQLPKLDVQELFARSFKDSAAPAFKEWLERANEEEKTAVLKMLQCAETDEERIQTLLLGVLNPDMMTGVQTWLKSAGDSDKRVVLKLLQSIEGVKELTSDPKSLRPGSRQDRSYSRRKSFPSRHARAATYPQVTISELPNYRGDDYNRWVYNVETGRNTGHYRTAEKNGKPFVLWHHRTVRDPTPRVYHSGSIFATPKKPTGQHFAIIPEWPIA
ncbi:uncharacterized protein LOC134192274 [Corticium candelabrum]|uniref:uncharacterized protein LOC134192274 n=1 Tax=Corticium candelabrum TaxID=121492 RepID=UPI002E271059|nr:uncharacterized protein LOC134192274 [Corticium candelabrum]